MRRDVLIACSLALASPAGAQPRGSSGEATSSLPAREEGERLERSVEPARELPADPSHGILGAPGAAPDAFGPDRLGPHARLGVASAPWRSGDRARSPDSADVRAARVQVAPDIEQGTAQGSDASNRSVPAKN